MQERELYINGQLIELNDTTVIGLTKQANKLGELQNRQGDFTNSFKIPLTGNNMLALEHCNLMPSTSNIPYQRNSVIYRENGIEIISDGEGFIPKVNQMYFYLEVVGGNVDLSRAIGDIRVGELYSYDEAHAWNLTNAVNSRDGSQYYIYPFIDWRTDLETFFDTPTVDVRQMLPCIPAPDMFNRLSNEIGYTFAGSYIDSDDHQNMVITPDQFKRSDETLDEQGIESTADYGPDFLNVGSSQWVGYTVSQGTGTVSNVQKPGWLPAGSYPQGDSYTYESSAFGNFVFSVGSSVFTPFQNQVGVLKFTARFFVYWNLLSGDSGANLLFRNYYMTYRIKDSGGVIAEETTLPFNVQPSIIPVGEHIINFEIPETNLVTTETYFFEVELHAQQHSNRDTFIRIQATNATFSHTITDAIVFGNDINFRDLFRMKVSDVFKDILNKRGVLIQADNYSKVVNMSFFQDLIDNQPNALDWSNKIDVRSSELSFKFGNYAQRNWFRFAPDEDVTDELGDFYFDISDTTLDPVTDVVQLSHAATEQTAKYLGRIIPEIEGLDSVNKWQEPGFRILQMKRQDTSYNVTFTDGSSNSIQTTTIPFCEFVGFDTLIPSRYQALTDILTNTKAIVLQTKLEATDIHSLDFSIPIFLDIPELEINGYFYINQIPNYREGLIPVEYIRL